MQIRKLILFGIIGLALLSILTGVVSALVSEAASHVSVHDVVASCNK